MDQEVREMLRGVGMSDNDIGKLSRGQQKMLAARPVYSKYRMVAEVVESTYCFAGLKPGHKYVFSV